MYWARAIIVYGITIFLFRLLGRSLKFQSRPYDMVVQILLGSSAATLIFDLDVPIWRAFTSLGTLAIMHGLISYLSLWNGAKNFLVGKPEVLVENGQILRANLIKHTISVDELMGALRVKGYRDLSFVEFAQLEPSGNLSVVPRSQFRPVTPADLHLTTAYEGYSVILVADGKIDHDNLSKCGLTEGWLRIELDQRGISSPRDVLFASLDSQGELFLVRNQDVPLLQAIFKGVYAQTTPGLPPRLENRH